MSQATAKRASLLIGCGSAALALGLMLGSAPARAQGIQADGTVTFGGANIDQTVPSQTTVDVFTRSVVIDWQPLEDAAGNALDFLPTGATAFYRNNPNASFIGEFAVLNRILPSTNGDVAVINGSVISQTFNASGGSTSGGFIAFYSPTGILVGSTASFDVGKLLLTTLDTTPNNFDQFAQTGFGLQLQGAQGSTARIRIDPGAEILATPENAFFAVVAADVEMRGIARVNGSHAYVAGEAVNLTFDNGLFSISVPVGTAAAGEVVTLDGTIGGPSSTGTNGDNHLIYAVARASQDPISMLLRGNLGFDPAQSAGVVNGEIILAANHNVFGRTVDGGSISNGTGAIFGANSALSGARADIDITDATVTGSLLAVGSHRVTAAATGADSSFAGNLLLVGRESANLIASGGNDISIAGDVLIDAQDYGVSGSGLQSLDVINAAAGSALIEANAGSTITVGGSAFVLANAFAGTETISRIAGIARGGSAAISANGGTVDITGAASVGASGLGTNFSDIITGAEARGGAAEVRVRAGGTVNVGQDLAVFADARGAQGSLQSASSVSNAYGGTARLSLFDGGGTITVTGPAFLGAGATSGSVNVAGAGAIADAGEATVSVQEGGLIEIGSDLVLNATARGGANTGGTGGVARGGRASALVLNGGTITVGGDFDADALAAAGDGLTGGEGLGGIAGAVVNVGEIAIAGRAFAGTEGLGGAAFFGGNGGIGRGGNSAFQAGGTATQTARLTIGGDAIAFAQGVGGRGGDADDRFGIPGGRGGDGYGGNFTLPNQADPAFNSGAFILAGGDNGTIIVTGSATAVATGVGGDGGSDNSSTLAGGRGGNAFGGLAQVGLALLGGTGALGQGRATFDDVFAQSDAFAGAGGASIIAQGDGGEATGGTAVMTLRAGDATATIVELSAIGYGGTGGTGGIGRGGESAIVGSLGGTLVTSGVEIRANGVGGVTNLGTGGDGIGGVAEMEIDGTRITINGDLSIEANGAGGFSADGAGGNGLGGEAYIGQAQAGNAGILSVTGHTEVFANGRGGDSVTGFAAGNGQGGHAWIRSSAGATKTFGSVQLTAIGRGGEAAAHEGGNGTGGLVELISTGTGSRITILRNVPDAFATESPGGSAILNASGFGEVTNGGDGIGGLGRGGTILVSAALGGAANLPVNILADPDRAADSLFMLAQGTGGDSAADGGTGGAGIGGGITLLVDGGTLVAGAATPSTFAQGGNSGVSTSNITGGDATGGSRVIRVINNGTITLGNTGGGAGAQGGNGSGSGNGGDATAGSVLFEVLNATANLAGTFGLFNTAIGGNGQRGGNAGGGSITVNASNATIALANSPTGGAGFLTLDSAMTGGEGIVAGGDATGTTVNITLNSSSLTGGTLSVVQNVAGGLATSGSGTGGNATGANVEVDATGSTLSLVGPLNIIASARGGDAGPDGTGGTGVGGVAALQLAGSTLTLTPGAQGAPANITIRGDGSGGFAGTVGNGTGGFATLFANGGSVDAGRVLLSAQGTSNGLAGQTGTFADGGIAGMGLSGAATFDADTITIIASADTATGGAARGGLASFTTSSGSTANLTANSLSVSADALGADPNALAYTAGRFIVRLLGGSANLGDFTASAIGNLLEPDPEASRIEAVGGSLNVTGQLNAFAFGDIIVTHGENGFIGNGAVGPVTSVIQIDTRGTLTVESIVPGAGGNTSAGGGTGGLRGQSVDLFAGRSILIDGNVSATTGGVSLTANLGGGQALAQPGVSGITMLQGARIDGGTSSVTIHLVDGLSDPQRQTGAITLANITASAIDVRNFGMIAGSNINVLADGVLTASGSGRAIDLAALGGEVINLHGNAGLILTGGGHFGIFAATPTGSQIGSPGNFARRYNVLTETAYDALNPGGNFAAFRITPVLTVTADDIARFYGDANPAFTATIAGFLPGDSIADITGAAQFVTLADGTSPIGQYAIDADLGSLLSAQGYQFSFAPGILTITPRPITITANSFSRIYGNANPALGFVVGGQGLVNGDQLSGALATTAGLTSGVGIYGITQGSLDAGANYAVTFVGGQLTITPRPITIDANSFSRIYGNANPALTFTVGGQGLVNGDQLSGALTTIAGVTTGVGSYAITQGTLTAGANYTVTYNAGGLTITPRPITITADSFSRVYGNANPALTFGIGGQGLVNGDQLTGALAAAGVTAGVGTSAITLGTLSAGANY
ncbi:MAG: hypothetical protein NBV68_03805, partial [Erythrobacter sp.]|uniref:MBG domain-containing protein n=1 Tax=Erythrobacter sp. TaxID=1042 RepID=UPI0025F35825